MNIPIKHQVIAKDGRPLFVLVPYEEYVEVFREEPLGPSIPHHVVGLVVKQGYSLIRAWREHLGLTQEEVASRAGISQAALSEMEKPGHRTRLSTIRKLAAALGLEPEQLKE